jgi:hypothetical protein
MHAANSIGERGDLVVGGSRRRGGADRQEIGRQPRALERGVSLGAGGWWVLYEPELRLDGELLVPTLAGWRDGRLVALPIAHVLELAPDWVCEVCVTSLARVDLDRKLAAYARAAVAHCWVIDPAAHLVERLRREGACWRIVSSGGEPPRLCLEPPDESALDRGGWWISDGDLPIA